MRRLWIWILSGLALLLGGLLLVRCIHRQQPMCYYGPPVKEPDSLELSSKAQRQMQLQQRLDSLRNIIEERQNSEIYGPPEIMKEYGKETRWLKAEADSLEIELKALEEE